MTSIQSINPMVGRANAQNAGLKAKSKNVNFGQSADVAAEPQAKSNNGLLWGLGGAVAAAGITYLCMRKGKGAEAAEEVGEKIVNKFASFIKRDSNDTAEVIKSGKTWILKGAETGEEALILGKTQSGRTVEFKFKGEKLTESTSTKDGVTTLRKFESVGEGEAAKLKVTETISSGKAAADSDITIERVYKSLDSDEVYTYTTKKGSTVIESMEKNNEGNITKTVSTANDGKITTREMSYTADGKTLEYSVLKENSNITELIAADGSSYRIIAAEGNNTAKVQVLKGGNTSTVDDLNAEGVDTKIASNFEFQNGVFSKKAKA